MDANRLNIIRKVFFDYVLETFGWEWPEVISHAVKSENLLARLIHTTSQTLQITYFITFFQLLMIVFMAEWRQVHLTQIFCTLHLCTWVYINEKNYCFRECQSSEINIFTDVFVLTDSCVSLSHSTDQKNLSNTLRRFMHFSSHWCLHKRVIFWIHFIVKMSSLVFAFFTIMNSLNCIDKTIHIENLRIQSIIIPSDQIKILKFTVKKLFIRPQWVKSIQKFLSTFSTRVSPSAKIYHPDFSIKIREPMKVATEKHEQNITP